MKKVFKDPLFYTGSFLFILLMALLITINPNFVKRAAAAISDILGEGTANYLSVFTSSKRIGDSQIYSNGTNVGVGKTNPTQKLDVNGNVAAYDYWIQAAAGGAGKFASQVQTGTKLVSLYQATGCGLTSNTLTTDSSCGNYFLGNLLMQ